MLVTGGSRVITSFELPSSLGSAFTTGTFVKTMVVSTAILAAAAAAVSPVPVTRAAGGAGDVLPLHSAWGRRCFARGLDVNWERKRRCFGHRKGLGDQGAKSFRLCAVVD